MDKILAYSPWTSREAEEASIMGWPGEHAPSRAFLLEHAKISGPMITRGGLKAAYGYGPERRLMSFGTPMRRATRAHLVSSWAGSLFFGPFLRDLPLEMIPAPEETKIGLPIKPYPHEKGYRDLLGLPEPDRWNRGQVDELIVYEDFAQNSAKADRYRKLRARLRTALGSPQVTPPGVYLRRGQGGETRHLVNEDEIEAHLAGLGFDILDPDTMAVEELARRALDTPLVISVEGSHLSHAIYPLADDGAFIVLQPPDRFSTVHKQVADRLEMGFAFLVCTPTENGFKAEPDNLDRLINRMVQRHS